MEGLEITILNFNELKLGNFTFRFDSEYQKKTYLRNLKIIKNFPNGNLKLEDYIVNLSGGATPLGAEYCEQGVIFLRVQNIMQNFFNLDDVVYISQEQHQQIKRSELKENDVLLTITGVSYGKSATVTKYLSGANINQHSVKITLKDNLDPYFLSTFLNCKIGKLQSDKYIVGVTRPALDYESIKNFIIPTLSNSFQINIKQLIKKSEELNLKTQYVYTQAEALLLKTLKCSNSLLSLQKFDVKSFKESFAKTGRLDAEYYQRKYEKIISHITAQTHAKLSDLVHIQKSIEPGSDAYTEDEEGLLFLRVADFSKFGITPPPKRLKKNFVSENQNKLENLKPKKNTILFSKDGSVGEAYCLREDATFVTSGAILHLTIKEPKKLLPDYLTLVLNSQLVQMQAERDAGGSIILHWRINEIEKVLIPILDLKSQEKISNFINQSFKLKTESEKLLETAKRAVEIAIEQDEETAMKFITEQTHEVL